MARNHSKGRRYRGRWVESILVARMECANEEWVQVFGQEPKVLQEITSWVMDTTKLPVLVKLTPNITDIVKVGMAAKQGGADGVSLINTIKKSIMGIDPTLLHHIQNFEMVRPTAVFGIQR